MQARLAPSAAPRWANCAGSVVASEGAPRFDSEASRRGTAAHWLGAQVLRAVQAYSPRPETHHWEGKAAPNGVIVDAEMADGVAVYVNDVREVATRHGVWSMRIENRLEMPNIHAENSGTPDLVMPILDHKLLHIWDYKNGHGEVKAKDNWQLINYLAGVVSQYEIKLDREITVIARIVQPFCYSRENPIDEWAFQLSDLREPFAHLRKKAREALGDNPTFNTGEWCRHCPALRVCSAARKASYNFIDYVDAPYSMDTMSGPELATERGILQRGVATAKARLAAIEDDLISRISDGETDTGLSLTETKGRLDWSVPASHAMAFAAQFGADISRPSVQTPTQARAAVSRDLRPQFETVLASVTQRKSGKLKLTDADDTPAARAFQPKESK